MAITTANRGTGTNNTSNTSFTFSPASNFAAGSSAVLVIAADNSSSSGTTNNLGVTSDSLGNTWQKCVSAIYDPGAASAGVQGSIYLSHMLQGILTTGSVITARIATAAVAKAWALLEIVPTSTSYRIRYLTQAVNTGSATASPTVTTSSITAGDCIVCGLFNEYGTAQVVTADSDTTNGTWSTQQTASVGTTTSGMCVAAQAKVVSGTATQTYNPTLGTSSDVILGWISLTEALKTTALRDVIGSLLPVARTQ